MIGSINSSVHYHPNIKAIVKNLYCTVPCSSTCMPKRDLHIPVHVHVDHAGSVSVVYEMNVYSN